MELPIAKSNKITEEDYKPSEDLDNLDEINPTLLKIIEKHHDKINNITNTINFSEIIGYLAFLVFLLMLTIRLSTNIGFSWLILLAPALTCVIAFTILLNAYLKLKDLFDEAEIFESEKSNHSLGSILSYFSLNAASLCVMVYLVLLGLKLQNLVSISFNETTIAIYVLYGIATFYYIFIFPAFIKNKLIFPLFMFGVYIISSFVFFLLLNMRLDRNLNTYYTFVFSPLLISPLLHMICYSYLIIISSKKDYLNSISILVALALLLSGLLLVGLKADSLISVDIWVPMVLAILAYMILISDKLYSFLDQSGNTSGTLNKNEQFVSNNTNNGTNNNNNNNNFDSEKQF